MMKICDAKLKIIIYENIDIKFDIIIVSAPLIDNKWYLNILYFNLVKINRHTRVYQLRLFAASEGGSHPFYSARETESAIKRHGYFICAVIAYFDFFPVIQSARYGCFQRAESAGLGSVCRYVDVGISLPFFRTSIESPTFLFGALFRNKPFCGPPARVYRDWLTFP